MRSNTSISRARPCTTPSSSSITAPQRCLFEDITWRMVVAYTEAFDTPFTFRIIALKLSILPSISFPPASGPLIESASWKSSSFLSICRKAMQSPRKPHTAPFRGFSRKRRGNSNQMRSPSRTFSRLWHTPCKIFRLGRKRREKP